MDLINAIIKNDQQKVASLLSKGCDPNQAEDAINVTPLHFAAQYNHVAAAIVFERQLSLPALLLNIIISMSTNVFWCSTTGSDKGDYGGLSIKYIDRLVVDLK